MNFINSEIKIFLIFHIFKIKNEILEVLIVMYMSTGEEAVILKDQKIGQNI